MSPGASLVGSGVLAILALLSGWWAYRARRLAAAIEETPTTPAGKVSTPGYFEVKGKIACKGALRAPSSGKACVYYHHKVWDEIEVTRYDRKDKRYETHRSRRTVLEETKLVPFLVEDASGKLGVYPEGATIEATSSSVLLPVVDGTRRGGGGGILGAIFGSRQEGERLVARHEDLTILELGRPLYALGRVLRHPEGLVMQKDTEADKPFVLSVRSEADLLAEHRWQAQLGLAGAAAFGTGAVLVLALFR